MPVRFRIVPERDLTIVTYSGYVTVEDSLLAAQRYAAHPDFRPDQRFLFDSREVTRHEKDYARFFEMQARMSELFAQTGRDQLIGCLVGAHEASREMAMLARRGWEPVKRLVMTLHEDEAEVLAFLGQPETKLADLLEATRAQG